MTLMPRLSVAAFALPLMTGAAHGDVLSLSATSATVFSSEDGGAFTTDRVDTTQTLPVRNFDSLENTPVDRAFISFDGQAVSGDATVTGLTLTLNTTAFTTGTTGIEVQVGGFDFLNDVATNANTTYATAATFRPTALGQISIELDASVFDEVNDADNSLIVRLIGLETANVSFSGTADANAPVLAVEFTPVPEPATAAIFGVAGLGMLTRRRRPDA